MTTTVWRSRWNATVIALNMGCGSSKTMIKPVKLCNENDTETHRDSREDTDRLNAGDPTVLPESVPTLTPPLRAQSPGPAQQSSERPESSTNPQQLLIQKIISSQQRQSISGEAYSLTFDDDGKQRIRPPPRLLSLQTRKKQEVTRKEDIEIKMRQAEKRRKEREKDMTLRMRKLAQPHVHVPVSTEEEHKPIDLLYPEQLSVPTRSKELQTPTDEECLEDQRPTDSPDLVNDSTPHQIHHTDRESFRPAV